MPLFKRDKRALPPRIDVDRVTSRPVGFNMTGELVNEDTALQMSAVMACVGLLADSVACLPVRTYKLVNGRKIDQPLPEWLRRPNDDETPFEFFHSCITQMALHGDLFIFAPRKNDGNVLEIRVLAANHVNISLVESEVMYHIGNKPIRDVEHIRWWPRPGSLRGLSPLETQRNTIGLALAMERFLSLWYAEGGTPSSVLETDAQFTEEQARILQSTWDETHRQRRRPAVLSGGLKWKPIVSSAADMGLLESREHQLRSIARVFRIPSHMVLAQGDSQTYQNVESAGIAFVRHTLLPWISRLEAVLSKLLPPDVMIMFDTEEFMRADLMTRVRTQQVQIMSGTLTPNEARTQLGLEPYDGGDDFVMALPGAPMAGPSEDPTKATPVGVDAEPPQ